MMDDRWNNYWKVRNLSRNKLILLKHQMTTEVFVRFFSTIDLECNILDVGCGDGFYLDILRNLGFVNIKGIDLSSDCVRKAKEKGHRAEVTDIVGMSDEEKYDVIILIDVLEHVDEPEPFLTKLAGLLTKRGIIYLNVPVANSINSMTTRLLCKKSRLDQIKEMDETHLHDFELKSLKLLAQGTGLTVRNYWYIYNPFPGWLRRFRCLHYWTIGNRFGDGLSLVLGR